MATKSVTTEKRENLFLTGRIKGDTIVGHDGEVIVDSSTFHPNFLKDFEEGKFKESDIVCVNAEMSGKHKVPYIKDGFAYITKFKHKQFDRKLVTDLLFSDDFLGKVIKVVQDNPLKLKKFMVESINAL